MFSICLCIQFLIALKKNKPRNIKIQNRHFEMKIYGLNKFQKGEKHGNVVQEKINSIFDCKHSFNYVSNSMISTQIHENQTT